MIDELTEILKHYTPLISVITFVLGLLAGNWLALGRDKRKEFNETAEPVRLFLKRNLQHIKDGQIYKIGSAIDSENIEILIERSGRLAACRINKAWQRYTKLAPTCGNYDTPAGLYQFTNIELLRSLTANLLKSIPRK